MPGSMLLLIRELLQAAPPARLLPYSWGGS